MGRSLYIINPPSDFPSYFAADFYGGSGFEPAVSVADLAVTTVAAFAPDEFDVRLCEAGIEPVDWDARPDFVALTCKANQLGGLRRIARHFRGEGVVVMIGGPLATLSPASVRDDCDILVQGEIENIAEKLFADLLAGDWRDTYAGDRPDLASSPVPRWKLYPNDRAMTGSVQTSRGCPFECEFCDVIQYLGRRQRHKPVGKVLRELDELYKVGYRSVFLCDDNLTANRKHAKALMAEVGEWNHRQVRGASLLSTQISIDAARDDELLELCSTAGLINVFVGLETPNEDSLRETKKKQNLVPVQQEVEKILSYGIGLYSGLIVGFDSDGPDIFARQLEFCSSLPIPVFTLSSLVAPEGTPLFDRMQREGRLQVSDGDTHAAPWRTNFRVSGMTEEEMTAGMRWLCNRLYRPAAFGERVLRMIECLGPRRDPLWLQGGELADSRSVIAEYEAVAAHIRSLGEGEAEMVDRVLSALVKKPAADSLVHFALERYAQIRFMYERGGLWDPTC